MTIINYYRNRKLYDTSTSEYISHKELLGLVRNNFAVKVINAATRQDITAAVLHAAYLGEQRMFAPDLEEVVEMIKRVG